MQVEIVCDGKILRTATKDGKLYVEAPKKGAYAVRLRNDSPSRKEAVLSVDGINVINGEDAGYDGPGYVLRPWETIDVPGWRRSGGAVAAFEFKEQRGSYASQTGRGATNVGLIGVACFEEKVKQAVPSILRTVEHHHHDRWWPHPWVQPFIWNGLGDVVCGSSSDVVYGSSDLITSVFNASVTPNNSTSSRTASASPLRSKGETTKSIDVGTGYGAEKVFHTVDAQFERAGAAPSLVVEMRYATREALKKRWGVVIGKDEPAQRATGSAFPASSGASCPAPAGYTGR